LDEDGPSVTALVAKAAAGGQDAWNTLVERYAPLVMSVVARYRFAAADAQQVSQIVWLRLVEHLARLQDPRALSTWIITTTRSECVRLLRAARHTEPFDPSGTDAPGEVDRAAPGEQPSRDELGQALMTALAELPDWYRRLLLLLVEDPPLPYAEISRRLGIPVNILEATRASAIERLRRLPALMALFDADREPVDEGGGQHDVAAVAGR
jgi:RNA polymerase sigma factor (sigma-70 family)